MSLYKDKQLRELYDIKHMNDNITYKNINYEDKILIKTIPPYAFQNDNMNKFLLHMQKLVSILFNQMVVMKNFKNYIVDKYRE